MAREERHHRLEPSHEPDGRRDGRLKEPRLPASPESPRIEGYAVATDAATRQLQDETAANGTADQIHRAKPLTSDEVCKGVGESRDGLSSRNRWRRTMSGHVDQDQLARNAERRRDCVPRPYASAKAVDHEQGRANAQAPRMQNHADTTAPWMQRFNISASVRVICALARLMRAIPSVDRKPMEIRGFQNYGCGKSCHPHILNNILKRLDNISIPDGAVNKMG